MGTSKHSEVRITDYPLTSSQESWLAANAVSEEDKLASQQLSETEDRPEDPMQGLEGLDVAGPRAS